MRSYGALSCWAPLFIPSSFSVHVLCAQAMEALLIAANDSVGPAEVAQVGYFFVAISFFVAACVWSVR